MTDPDTHQESAWIENFEVLEVLMMEVGTLTWGLYTVALLLVSFLLVAVCVELWFVEEKLLCLLVLLRALEAVCTYLDLLLALSSII